MKSYFCILVNIFVISTVEGNVINNEISLEDSSQTCIENFNDLHALVHCIISAESNLDVVDVDGKSLVYKAAELGDLILLDRLIKNGANYNISDRAGVTPLHIASSNGFVDILRYFSKIFINVNAKDSKGKTPLHIAVENGCWESVNVLMEIGADTFARYLGQTSMHIAAGKGHTTIVRKLLSKNKNLLNDRDYDGHSPLWHAASQGRLETVKELIHSFQASISALDLWEAVDKGHFTVVKYIISKSKDVNLLNRRGEADSTYLVKAAERDFSDIARVLIDNGADVRAICCYSKWTALHEAALYNSSNVLKLLLDRGADISAMDRTGATPLDLTRKNSMLYKFLSERGAKPGNICVQAFQNFAH